MLRVLRMKVDLHLGWRQAVQLRDAGRVVLLLCNRLQMLPVA